MTKLCLFILGAAMLLHASTGRALQVSEYLNDELVYELHMQCASGESECQAVCGQAQSCTVPQGYCRSCAGHVSLLLNEFFSKLGDYFKAEPQKNTGAWLELVRSGNFITLTKGSLWNFEQTVSNSGYLKRFESLCQPAEEPVVFVEVENVTRVPMRLAFLSCVSTESLSLFKIVKAPQILKGG